METNTTGETSPLLRQLREVADSDEAEGRSVDADEAYASRRKADATDLRVLADLLSERRYADAYRHYRFLDTWVRDGVPDAIVRVLGALKARETYELTVDAAWAKIREHDIQCRLAELDAEASALRAELAALAAT
jgi:hypothetical protein